jgi:hypothetical protein
MVNATLSPGVVAELGSGGGMSVVENLRGRAEEKVRAFLFENVGNRWSGNFYRLRGFNRCLPRLSMVFLS